MNNTVFYSIVLVLTAVIIVGAIIGDTNKRSLYVTLPLLALLAIGHYWHRTNLGIPVPGGYLVKGEAYEILHHFKGPGSNTLVYLSPAKLDVLACKYERTGEPARLYIITGEVPTNLVVMAITQGDVGWLNAVHTGPLTLSTNLP